MQVVSGTPPSFTWEPECGISTVVVFDLVEPERVWSIQTLGPPIGPPVVYGRVPEDLREDIRVDEPSKTLIAGRTYEVSLWVGLGGRSTNVGSSEFIPR